MTRMPVYFVSHGGPNIIYDTQHPVYPRLTSLGDEIINKVRPKAVIAISAHWESSTPGVVEINSAEKTDLIYDFYGFPPHYYKHKYPSTGSPALASQISTLLADANLPSKHVKRGLDHGVFACFSVLFPPSTPNALSPDIPLVQISLPYASNNPAACFALGKALQPLRDEGVLILASGMAVHNLRDHFTAFDPSVPRPYTTVFDEALRAAIEGDDKSGKPREERMTELLKIKEARAAHPSWEHLWPVYVAAGAASREEGKEESAERIWTKCEGAMSWGMFRFGEVA